MNKEECIKIIKFELIQRQVFLRQHLNDENTKDTCQQQLDDMDKAVKYMEDNLDINECTICGDNLWYKCEKCDAKLCEKDTHFDPFDNHAQVCEKHLSYQPPNKRKK